MKTTLGKRKLYPLVCKEKNDRPCKRMKFEQNSEQHSDIINMLYSDIWSIIKSFVTDMYSTVSASKVCKAFHSIFSPDPKTGGIATLYCRMKDMGIKIAVHVDRSNFNRPRELVFYSTPYKFLVNITDQTISEIKHKSLEVENWVWSQDEEEQSDVELVVIHDHLTTSEHLSDSEESVVDSDASTLDYSTATKKAISQYEKRLRNKPFPSNIRLTDMFAYTNEETSKTDYYMIIPTASQFLFLEIDQSNYSHSIIRSYTWTSTTAVPNTMIFEDQAKHLKCLVWQQKHMAIIITKYVWYFFDLKQKRCLLPVHIPRSECGKHCAMAESFELMDDGYIKMILNKDDSTTDFYIKIPVYASRYNVYPTSCNL